MTFTPEELQLLQISDQVEDQHVRNYFARVKARRTTRTDP
jgi:hypothetical protein